MEYIPPIYERVMINVVLSVCLCYVSLSLLNAVEGSAFSSYGQHQLLAASIRRH